MRCSITENIKVVTSMQFHRDRPNSQINNWLENIIVQDTLPIDLKLQHLYQKLLIY
jgi:hypothetical protein